MQVVKVGAAAAPPAGIAIAGDSQLQNNDGSCPKSAGEVADALITSPTASVKTGLDAVKSPRTEPQKTARKALFTSGFSDMPIMELEPVSDRTEKVDNSLNREFEEVSQINSLDVSKQVEIVFEHLVEPYWDHLKSKRGRNDSFDDYVSAFSQISKLALHHKFSRIQLEEYFKKMENVDIENIYLFLQQHQLIFKDCIIYSSEVQIDKRATIIKSVKNYEGNLMFGPRPEDREKDPKDRPDLHKVTVGDKEVSSPKRSCVEIEVFTPLSDLIGKFDGSIEALKQLLLKLGKGQVSCPQWEVVERGKKTFFKMHGVSESNMEIEATTRIKKTGSSKAQKKQLVIECFKEEHLPTFLEYMARRKKTFLDNKFAILSKLSFPKMPELGNECVLMQLLKELKNEIEKGMFQEVVPKERKLELAKALALLENREKSALFPFPENPYGSEQIEKYILISLILKYQRVGLKNDKKNKEKEKELNFEEYLKTYLGEAESCQVIQKLSSLIESWDLEGDNEKGAKKDKEVQDTKEGWKSKSLSIRVTCLKNGLKSYLTKKFIEAMGTISDKHKEDAINLLKEYQRFLEANKENEIDFQFLIDELEEFVQNFDSQAGVDLNMLSERIEGINDKIRINGTAIPEKFFGLRLALAIQAQSQGACCKYSGEVPPCE